MSAASGRVRRAAAMAAVMASTLAPSVRAAGLGPRPAKICAACHGPIQRAWQESSKAHSWTNPVFQAGLAEAKAARGERIVLRCLSCHAPLAAVTADLAVLDPVAQEGITCNFCHNVSAVDPSPLPASYTFDPMNPNLMRGPYRDAEPGSAHEAVYSDTLTRSEFCASCHWGENDDQGVTFEATFPEWRASRAAAAGRQCQDCHMPPAPGKASALSKKSRPSVYAHTFVGPRTPGGLDSVATVAAGVEGGRLRVLVRNTRGGHALPGGGHSMRAISLEAIFYDGAGKELSRAAVATYGTEFADSAGHAPVPKWLGVTVARSHEIPADSTVVEWADLPAGAKRAAITLTYLPLAPVYRARLEAAHVDLKGRDPVLLARSEVPLP